jgi:hypothetical protein
VRCGIEDSIGHGAWSIEKRAGRRSLGTKDWTLGTKKPKRRLARQDKRTEVRGKKKEERDSPVGAAFSRDLAL